MMDSLADNYLLFISKSVSSFSKVLLKKDENVDLEKITDVIYDYLNEVFLLEKNIDDINFSKYINTKLTVNENSLLNIFLEYGLIDRIKIKDKSIKKSYMFVVDTINCFINVYKNVYKDAGISYSLNINKILRKNKFIDKVLLKESLESNQKELESIYLRLVKSIKKINYQDDKFNLKEQKINNDIYLVEPLYQNDLMLRYNNRELDFVLSNYNDALYINSLEKLSITIINNLLLDIKRNYYIYLPNYIVKSKKIMSKIVGLFDVYLVRESICFILDRNVFMKYGNTLPKEVKYGIFINDYDINEDYSDLECLIINYEDDIDNLIKKYNKELNIFINGKIPKDGKEMLSKYNDLNYCNIKVSA